MTPIEFTYGVFVGQTALLNIPQLHWLWDDNDNPGKYTQSLQKTYVLNNITNLAIGCFFLDIIIEKSLNVLTILKFSKNPI